MDALVILPATAHDLEWAAGLMALSSPWRRPDFTRDDALDIVRRPCSTTYMARFPGSAEPVGFISLNPHGVAGSPYIHLLGVAEEFRGRGAGRQLLAFAERHFAGQRNLFICVTESNQGAHRLYLRAGFRRLAKFDDYKIDGQNELLLHKRIP